MIRRNSAFPLLILLAGLVLMRCQGPSEPDDPDYSVLPRALTAEEIQLAAAATVVVMVWESTGSEREGFILRVDRPFVFVIRERTSGTLLFMGKIVEPVWEEG